MGNSSSSARPCASEANERSRREVGGVAAAPPSSSTTSRVSSFEKTVYLHDWWLIKVEDECSRARLGVGGLHSRGKTVRIFKSAPIVKRCYGDTLETADGITVMINGLINASRMHQNGFPSEACNHFQIGFPYYWKDYVDTYFQADTKGNGDSSSSAHPCASEVNERSRRVLGGVAATPPSSSTTSCVSSFEKTVFLHDWWLIKVEDECSPARLGVGGLHTTGKAACIFKSAPIVKTYGVYTLETADGITVRIHGRINASRMHQNGFPSEAGKTPQARQRTQEPSFTSPELLNYKRSRSGRLLVPPLANWCQKVLYDVDGSVAGILTGVDAMKWDRRGTTSESSRKRKEVT